MYKLLVFLYVEHLMCEYSSTTKKCLMGEEYDFFKIYNKSKIFCKLFHFEVYSLEDIQIKGMDLLGLNEESISHIKSFDNLKNKYNDKSEKENEVFVADMTKIWENEEEKLFYTKFPDYSNVNICLNEDDEEDDDDEVNLNDSPECIDIVTEKQYTVEADVTKELKKAIKKYDSIDTTIDSNDTKDGKDAKKKEKKVEKKNEGKDLKKNVKNEMNKSGTTGTNINMSMYMTGTMGKTKKEKRKELQNYINGILKMNSEKELEDAAMKFFLNYNTKKKRKIIINSLFQMSKNNLSSIPYYCKFIAIINKYVKDIYVNIVEELKKFTEKMIKEKLPETINKKMKCVRFICELSKFQLLDLVYILEFINLLIENFTSDNAELCHYVFDNCALLLLSTSKTHIRFLNILKRFKKIKNSKNLTSQMEMLFDECYLKINNFITKNTVRTGHGGNKKKVSKYTEAELQKKYFLKRLLFSDILTKDADVICKYIRKFDWEDKFVERCLKKYIFQYLMYMSFFQINYIASLLFHLAKYKPFFVTQIIDELYERILVVLENYEYEKFPFLIQYVRLFAELYNYKILSSENVFDMLYFFIALADLDICNSHHVSSIYKLFHENKRFFTNGQRGLVNSNTSVHKKKDGGNDDNVNFNDNNNNDDVERKKEKTQTLDMNEIEKNVNGIYESGSLNGVMQKKELKEAETEAEDKNREKEEETNTNINAFICLKKRTGIGTDTGAGVEEVDGVVVDSGGSRERTSVKIADINMEMKYENKREEETSEEENFFSYNGNWNEKCINYLFINRRNPIVGHILNETQRFSFINIKLICIIIENCAKYLRKPTLIFKFKKFCLFFMRFLLVLGTLPLHIYDMVEKVVHDHFEELLMLKTVNSVDMYLLRMLNAEYKLYLNEVGGEKIQTVTESDLEAPLEELKKMYTLHIEELNKKKEQRIGKGKKNKSYNEFERIVLPEKKEDGRINADDTSKVNEVDMGMYSAKEETDIDVYCRETQIYKEGGLNTNNHNIINNNNHNNNNNIMMNSIYRYREDLMQDRNNTKLQVEHENYNINDNDIVDMDVDDDFYDDDDDITDGYVNTTLSKSVLMEADELDKEINAMINESLKERKSNLTNDIESFRSAFMTKNENNERKKINVERGKVRILLKKSDTTDESKCRNGPRDDVPTSKKNVKIKKAVEQKGSGLISGFVSGSGAGMGTSQKAKTEEEEKDDAYIKSFVLNRAENLMEEDRRKEELRLKKMLYKNSLKYADYEDDLDDFYA